MATVKIQNKTTPTELPDFPYEPIQIEPGTPIVKDDPIIPTVPTQPEQPEYPQNNDAKQLSKIGLAIVASIAVAVFLIKK